MSDKFSTSAFFSFSASAPGDVVAVRGLCWVSCCGVLPLDSEGCTVDDVAEIWPLSCNKGLPFDVTFSARRFSSVPRSVLPASSSVRRPDIFNNDSIRPSRFSRPSMYLALSNLVNKKYRDQWQMFDQPFRRIAFLLNLREDAFRLVIRAVRALRLLRVAFNLSYRMSVL